jgi:hypothetical protein
MTIGRTPSGAIKIKTDSPLGLRAVNCACCGPCNFPQICFDGSPSFGWVLTPFNPPACYTAGLGPNETGYWEIYVYDNGSPTEFVGFGLDLCCNKSCYGQKDNMDDPVLGTYTINTLDCGIVSLTITEC